MSVKEKLKAGGSKVLGAGMSFVLAVGLMPMPAFAADLNTAQIRVQASTAKSSDGYVIAAAFAAAEPAPELLGLNNPNYRNSGEADDIYPMFGDETVNESVDPFVYNYKNNLDPGIVIGGRTGAGPMAELSKWSTTDPNAEQNAVWQMLPQIVLGTGSADMDRETAAAYYQGTNANLSAIEEATGQSTGTYKPVGVAYNNTTLITMRDTMYILADEADKAMEAGNLKTRYEDPMEIARDYERYIIGSKGLVKRAIDTGKVKEKTIALVQSYDSTAKTYTIITDGVAEGTATTNRYLEAVAGVTKNYYDTVGAAGSTSVTKEQLEKYVDVIIVGGNAGDTNAVRTNLSKDGLLGKTFYCTNWGAGAVFGTTVNSVENAQNVGRILPCVYPTVLDQSDMVAYYYDVFYHIKDGEIANMMAEHMDGVRNWGKTDSASYTAWETSDYTGYNHGTLEAELKAGIAYLNGRSGLGVYLTPSENVASDKVKVDLKDAKVTVSAGVLADGKAEPEPTVTYGSKVLVKDTDYTVAYSNNTTAGETGMVTITAKDGSEDWTGSTSATFKVLAAENFTASAITVSGIESAYDFTGHEITPEVTVKEGESTLTQDKDYTVTYSNNKDAGEATATISGIGDYSGTLTENFTINKVKPTLSIMADKAKLNSESGNYDYVYGDSPTITTAADATFTLDEGKVKTTVNDGNTTYDIADTKASAGKGLTYNSQRGWVISKIGTYIVTFSGEGATKNCDAPDSVSVTLNIAQLNPSIKFSADIESELKESGAITKTYLKDFLFSLGTNVGKYDGTLEYSSDVADIALVSPSGKVAIVGGQATVGRDTVYAATITVKAPATPNCTAAADRTVKIQVDKIAQTITASNVTKKYGDKAFNLGAVASDKGALTYKSSNPTVASVNTDGVVTVGNLGTAKITVNAAATESYGAGTKQVTVTVNGKDPTIKTTNKTTSVAMGKTLSLGASVDSKGTLSYKSSNTAVAKVSTTGVITPVKVGTATITISAAAKGNYAAGTKTVKITVTKGTPTISAKTTAKTVTIANAKKAAQKLAMGASVTGGGKLTYRVKKPNSNITFSNGTATLKKGTYKAGSKQSITVTVSAAASTNYNKATKDVTLTFTIKK